MLVGWLTARLCCWGSEMARPEVGTPEADRRAAGGALSLVGSTISVRGRASIAAALDWNDLICSCDGLGMAVPVGAGLPKPAAGIGEAMEGLVVEAAFVCVDCCLVEIGAGPGLTGPAIAECCMDEAGGAGRNTGGD